MDLPANQGLVRRRFMLRILVSLAGATLFASASHAAIIQIDDFNTPSGPVIDLAADGSPTTVGPQPIVVNGNALTRTVSVDLLSSAPPVDAKAEVLGGIFDIALGTGEDAAVSLSYDVSALEDDFDAYSSISSLALLVNIVGADGTEKTLEAIMNGSSLGVFDLPDQVEFGSPELLTFNLPTDTEVTGDLEFLFNGNAGYDLAVQLIGFEVFGPQEAPVPEPGALGLLGLGALGVAAAARRKRR